MFSRKEIKVCEIDCHKNRLDYIDIAKGISMLCIIAGHMGSSKISQFVFTFHVPVFFLISGYFYKYRKGILKHRFKQLLVPYFFTCVAMIIFFAIKTYGETKNISGVFDSIITWIIASLYGSGARTDFFGLNVGAVGAIWFLLASFFATMFFTIFYEITEKITSLASRNTAMIGMSIILCKVGIESANYTWLPFSVQAGMVSTIFFTIGYIYKQLQNSLDNIVKRKLFIGFIIVWLFSLYRSFLTGDLLNLVIAHFPSPALDVVGAMGGGSLFIVFVAKLIANSRSRIVKDFFEYIGKHSLMCLCIHLFELNCFQYDKWFWFISGKKYFAIVLMFKILFNICMILLISFLNKKFRLSRKTI